MYWLRSHYSSKTIDTLINSLNQTEIMNTIKYKMELTTLFKYFQIVSGTALLLFLLLHFSVLYTASLGEDQFSALINSYHTLPVIILERFAFIGMIFHILNGLRIILISFGRWIEVDDDLCQLVLWGTVIFAFIHAVLPFLIGGH